MALLLIGCAGGGKPSDDAERARLARESAGVFGPADGTGGDGLDALGEADDGDQAPPQTGDRRGARRNESATGRGSGSGQTPGGNAGSRVAEEPGGWGVLLASASGDGAKAVMEQQRPQLAQLLGRRDVRVSRQRSGYAVVLGNYGAPSDPAAQRDLAFVKSFEVDGRRPFARAHLMPPVRVESDEVRPVTPHAKEEWNLAVVREGLGKQAGFTLQIGVFESSDRAAAMRAAENWVHELRQAGEEAYFYHGRTASMVSVGVFGREDWDALLDVAGPRVRALQRKYPTLRLERLDERSSRKKKNAEPERPSLLVMIPER
jgi:hypothetical protein